MPEGTIRVLGIEGLEGKLDANLNVDGPVRRMLTRGAVTVRDNAVKTVAVDRGRLRGSLAWEVDSASPPLWGRAGTNMDYGPDIEFGTPPHYVAPADLEGWIHRKHIPRRATQISAIIAARGTKAQPFLAPALDDAKPQIDRFVAIAAQEIEDQKG